MMENIHFETLLVDTYIKDPVQRECPFPQRPQGLMPRTDSPRPFRWRGRSLVRLREHPSISHFLTLPIHE